MGGDAAEGLPDAEPRQHRRHQGRHQALLGDRGARADGSRCPTCNCSRAATIRPSRCCAQRLHASGDLQEQSRSQSFDYYVDKAVKRYQASNGLAPTGIVDKRTIAALNIPAASRLKQLQTNLGAPRGALQDRRQEDT